MYTNIYIYIYIYYFDTLLCETNHRLILSLKMGKVKIKHSQHPYDCIFGKTHIIWSIYQHTNLAITLKKQNRYNNKNNKKLKSEKNYLKLVFCNSYQLKFPINVPFRVDFQPSEVSQLES